MEQSFQCGSEFLLLKHPFYRAWMEGRLSTADLQDYAGQYYHHVDAFPGYLRNAIALCMDKETRAVLEENLAEEDGSAYGTSHPELWMRFAEGVGVLREQVTTATLRPGIRAVVKTFTDFSEASLPQALGCLYAYESQVPEIAESKLEGLRKHFGIHDERTLAFFEVHRTADREHRESLLKLIQDLPVDQKRQAKSAADLASRVLWNFLSDVQSYASIRK